MLAPQAETGGMGIKGPIDQPDVLIGLLQAALIDLYDLTITGKAKHWSVQSGTSAMDFLSVHRALDEIIDWGRDVYDTCAERIIQLGGFPDARVATIARSTPLVQVAPGALSPETVVMQVAANLQVLVDRFQTRIGASQRDMVTQNLMIEISTALQKFSWFWQASIPT